jgi:hypothetical protein
MKHSSSARAYFHNNNGIRELGKSHFIQAVPKVPPFLEGTSFRDVVVLEKYFFKNPDRPFRKYTQF